MKKKKNKSDYLWKTPVERVIFGYEAEIDCNPDRFFRFEYISSLIAREKEVQRVHSRIFKSLLIMNALSLLYIQGLKLNFSLFGQTIPQIPSSGMILSFFLGLTIFGFAIYTLDLNLLSRMRSAVIYKLTGTDLPNIATAHLKGDGIWVDILTPKFIGYSSGISHSFLTFIVYFCMVGFISCIYIASITSIISLFRFDLSNNSYMLNWPCIIGSAGIVMGIIGVILYFTANFIPLKFTLPEIRKSEENTTNALLGKNP